MARKKKLRIDFTGVEIYPGSLNWKHEQRRLKKKQHQKLVELASNVSANQSVASQLLELSLSEPVEKVPKEKVPTVYDKKADFRYEDTAKLFNPKVITANFILNRTEMTTKFLDMFTRNMSAQAAIDVAAMALSSSTDSAVEVEVGSLKSSIASVFQLEFLRTVADLASIPKAAIREMEKAYCLKTWGTYKPPPPVRNAPVAINNRSRDDDQPVKSSQMKSKISSRGDNKDPKMPRGFSPFGLL